MNAHDRQNLEFLRNLTEQSLLEWFEQASDDDVEYATELLSAWEDELTAEAFEDFGGKFTTVSQAIH